jgi:predicted alpha/beta-fold hydrolase
MKFVYVFGFVISSYFYYKYKQKTQKLLLVHSNNRLSRLFHLINIKFLENYKPGIFLFSGHAQTFLVEIFSIFIRIIKKIYNFYSIKYEREIFQLSDGGRIAIDTARRRTSMRHGKTTDVKPFYEKILLVLPGVTSSSSDYYIRSFVEGFIDEYECKVINARGFGGMKLFSSQLISTNCYKDLEEYICKISEENKSKKIFAVGFSFGGLLLTRYLGSSSVIPDNFLAGCGICYPPCIEQTKNFAELHFNGLYSKVSLNGVRNVFYDNLELIFDPKINTNKDILENKETLISEINKCRVLSDFDKVWTYRNLKLKNIEEYYTLSRLDQYIENIKVPFLSLFAEDDPIVPITSIPFNTLQENPHTVTIVTQHGGHLGFFGGILIPQRIIHQPISSFIKTVEILKDTQGEEIMARSC